MTDVTDNPDRHRYEMTVEGKTAVAVYERDDDTVTFTHTVVPSELEGRGIGSKLVKFALDDARANGLRVVPQCPFVAAWIERHPDYAELVA